MLRLSIAFYTRITAFLSPLIWLFIWWRCLRGKEERARLGERFGKASLPRAKGSLLWIHAASVGEAQSVLPLILKLREHAPRWQILVTTGTRTSAALMRARLPKGAVHQFVPMDTPAAARRFIRHWQPEIGLFVESELWPNLILEARNAYAMLFVINGRMSEKSFRTWNKHPKLIAPVLASFARIFAQSEESARHYRALGAVQVESIGNLKFDAAPLPFDEAALAALAAQLGTRPHLLAASTHEGEEALIANAMQAAQAAVPNLCLILVPRHPHRGVQLAEALSQYGKVALRSRGEPLSAATQIYIADTLGELGVLYRLCSVVFMGGSLVAHGGQNPLEPARLGCALLVGAHTHHFAEIYAGLEAARAVLRVPHPAALGVAVEGLLTDAAARSELQENAERFVAQHGGATAEILRVLTPLLAVEHHR